MHTHAHTELRWQADTHPVLCPLGGVGVGKDLAQSGKEREILFQPQWCHVTVPPQEGRREGSEKGGVWMCSGACCVSHNQPHPKRILRDRMEIYS